MYEKELSKTTPTPLLEKEGRNCLVVDPFCGSGNVAMEAMMLGLDVFGSDNSGKAVRDSQENIDWLLERQNEKCKSQNHNPKVKIIAADATCDNFVSILNSSFKILDSERLAIVAEPFLGEPKKFKPSENAARGEYRKIKDLYLSFFTNFKGFMDFRLPVVFCIVFPLVELENGKQFSLYRESVDEIKKIGYTELQSPLIYGRDYQVVKREIVLLQLKT